MNDVVGVVPAAGSGRRIFPSGGAKELLPVASERAQTSGGGIEATKLVGQFVLEAMAAAEVQRIVWITSPAKAALVFQHLDVGRYGVDVCFVVGSPCSMVHAINLAYPWVRDATVLLGMPDTIMRPVGCFGQLLDFHVDRQSELSLGLFPTSSPQRFGMVRVGDDDSITYHADKPRQTDASHLWGIAAWEPVFSERLHTYVRDLPANNLYEVVLGDVFDAALAEGRSCKALPIKDGAYYDVGTYADYRRAALEL